MPSHYRLGYLEPFSANILCCIVMHVEPIMPIGPAEFLQLLVKGSYRSRSLLTDVIRVLHDLFILHRGLSFLEQYDIKFKL